MNVSEAIAARRSVRGFLDTPVPLALVQRVLDEASRAPSGGNLQPWHVDVLSGAALDRFRDVMRAAVEENPRGEPDRDYPVYPKGLTAPYSDRRFAVGEALYSVLGVARENKPERIRWYKRNAELFGAPVGVFVTVDRQMGPPQWADLGMFLQSVMLLLVSEGLGTCAQEYFAQFPRTVGTFLETPPNRMLFTGLAIGWPDDAHPLAAVRTERAAVADFATFRDA